MSDNCSFWFLLIIDLSSAHRRPNTQPTDTGSETADDDDIPNDMQGKMSNSDDDWDEFI